MDARRTMAAEKAHGRWGQYQEQVGSNGDGGERRARGEVQEGSDNTSEGWIGESAEDSEGSETEEEATTVGRP